MPKALHHTALVTAFLAGMTGTGCKTSSPKSPTANEPRVSVLSRAEAERNKKSRLDPVQSSGIGAGDIGDVADVIERETLRKDLRDFATSDPQAAGQLLSYMNPGDAVDVLRELPGEVASHVLMEAEVMAGIRVISEMNPKGVIRGLDEITGNWHGKKLDDWMRTTSLNPESMTEFMIGSNLERIKAAFKTANLPAVSKELADIQSKLIKFSQFLSEPAIPGKSPDPSADVTKVEEIAYMVSVIREGTDAAIARQSLKSVPQRQ